jgi:hypothetical protein
MNPYHSGIINRIITFQCCWKTVLFYRNNTIWYNIACVLFAAHRKSELVQIGTAGIHEKYNTMDVILVVQCARLGWTAWDVWYSKGIDDTGSISHHSFLLEITTLFWINFKRN